MSDYVVGGWPGTGPQQRLAAVKAMATRLIEEDARVLNTFRLGEGTLVTSDKFLARYLRYVVEFPEAPALSR